MAHLLSIGYAKLNPRRKSVILNGRQKLQRKQCMKESEKLMSAREKMMLLLIYYANKLVEPMNTVVIIRQLYRYYPPEKKHRSEEHTSELQSRFDLVCRLLL